MITRPLIVALLVLSLTTGLAHATVLTFQNNFTFSSVGTTNLPISQFNPALGTLNSVKMSIFGTGSAAFAADNDYTFDGINASAVMQHQFLVTAPGVSASGSDSFSNTQALTADNGDGLGIFDPSAPDGYNWGTVTVGEYQVSGSPFTVGAPQWAAYTGLGNVLVGLNSQVFVSSITGAAGWYGPGTEFYLQNSVSNPSLNVRVQVDYDYTEPAPGVPEPCTLALLGIGAVGMGIRARRRRKTA